jgi:hypothetical protein
MVDDVQPVDGAVAAIAAIIARSLFGCQPGTAERAG